MTETATCGEFDEDSSETQIGTGGTDTLERRIRELLRELLSTHVESLFALLAEEGVGPAEQCARMDGLVRGFGTMRFEENLSQAGRPIPLQVDTGAAPPQIRLNRTLIAGIEEAEILRAFHAPIADILGISPVGVGLVLQCRDERQLKKLVNQAARRAGANRVRINQVPAIIEQRMALFEARLDGVAEHFGEAVFWLWVGRDEFLMALARAGGGWPEWEQIRDTPFISGVIDELEDGIMERAGAPSAELLVELCWESLELSPQAFLRHAAQQLRNHQDINLASALKSLSQMLAEKSDVVIDSADAWPVFGELTQAWQALYLAEQHILAGDFNPADIPRLSVFDSPAWTLGLCEPSSLPWDAPLLAWTVREHHALRDLLVGFRQALEGQRARGGGVETFEVVNNADEPPLDTEAAPLALQVQVIRQGYALPDNYIELLNRASSACLQSMQTRFCALDAAGQARVLQTLRAAYLGYFGGARAVWARRFQAWKMWEPARAFRFLSTEIRHILGPAMIFDPFEGPTSAQLSPAPNFVLIAPRPAEFERVLVYLPLAALRQSVHGAPSRIRLVDVPRQGPCAWIGDATVTMPTIEEHPTGVVLDAIENDSVRLLVYGASEHS